jgi:hypothetical protein
MHLGVLWHIWHIQEFQTPGRWHIWRAQAVAGWLHLAEFWYNTSWHALSKGPFEVLYGHAPRNFGIAPAGACPASELHEWLQEKELMQNVIKQHLSRAQERMKCQADKHRSERQFNIGGMVS